MTLYRLSPFVYFIESHLIPNVSQYAVAHRLTGQIVEPSRTVWSLLQAVNLGRPFSFNTEDVSRFGVDGQQIQALIEKFFLVPPEDDPLAPFVNHLVVWPLQNPAVAYRDDSGELVLARTSMVAQRYSPRLGELSEIIEERMAPLATKLFIAADGTRTLGGIHAGLSEESRSLLDDQEFRAALDFLTAPERQLLKLTDNSDLLQDPYQPPNIVPQNLFHSTRWAAAGAVAKSIADFHVEGIEDADWEFDVVEPTVNHGLRFPSDLLGGVNYGTRFCDAVLNSNAGLELESGAQLRVLEVGGGTGSFARSFIECAQAVRPLAYQILDLSPALADSQRQILGNLKPRVVFIAQDATELDLPGQTFDLIIANEVIADFPVAIVERSLGDKQKGGFSGDGAAEVAKYGLSTDGAPERFYVNVGVFRFLERAWNHLAPGGALIISEYGSETRYPMETYHLNHPEFSIHFGHVAECARSIGYHCTLKSLVEFLSIEDSKPVFSGRENHIRCLNHVFEQHGGTMPFALFSETDFEAQFGDLARRSRAVPIRFLPLRRNFHYGPNIADFLVLTLTKPGS